MLMVHDPVVPISGMLVVYSTSANITIAYNLGAIGGMAYGLQVASGILVAMTYVASDEYSFPTLDAAQRDSTYGWALRAVHANCASAVFAAMYIHATRAWLYSVLSTIHHGVWLAGIITWLMMMGIAFMGYVLPWGLMSYWALTVITNLMTVLPVIGLDLLCYC